MEYGARAAPDRTDVERGGSAVREADAVLFEEEAERSTVCAPCSVKGAGETRTLEDVDCPVFI